MPHQPKLVVSVGRGNRGQTWWNRWAVDRAQQAGRPVVVADADLINPTLSAYFDGVFSPPDAEDVETQEWVTAFIEQLAERKITASLDLGSGSNLLLKRINRKIRMVDFLEANGVQVVAAHILGPDSDDLAYLRSLEADRLFAPEATLLVLNEALKPEHLTFEAAFACVLENPIFLAAVERGAKLIRMPRLSAHRVIDAHRLTFSVAETNPRKDGEPLIGLTNQAIIASWRRTMEANFTSVAHWLP